MVRGCGGRMLSCRDSRKDSISLRTVMKQNWGKTGKFAEINHKAWRECNGRLVHDGDCTFWGQDICSCGLLHHLRWFADQDFGAELAIEDARHHIQLDRIPERLPYVPPTEEEVAKRMKWAEDFLRN